MIGEGPLGPSHFVSRSYEREFRYIMLRCSVCVGERGVNVWCVWGKSGCASSGCSVRHRTHAFAGASARHEPRGEIDLIVVIHESLGTIKYRRTVTTQDQSREAEKELPRWEGAPARLGPRAPRRPGRVQCGPGGGSLGALRGWLSGQRLGRAGRLAEEPDA